MASSLTVKSMLSTNVSPLGVLIGTPRRTMLKCDVTIQLKWSSGLYLLPVDSCAPPEKDTAFSTPPACTRVNNNTQKQTTE
jgi:hypothetical protein